MLGLGLMLILGLMLGLGLMKGLGLMLVWLWLFTKMEILPNNLEQDQALNLLTKGIGLMLGLGLMLLVLR
jgi:hypothetical protein